MAKGRHIVYRDWVEDVETELAQLRCWFEREGKRVLRFTVQLEVRIDDEWLPAIRCDNAHGFSHLDTLHWDGSAEKIPISKGDYNATLTWAQNELPSNWKMHYDRLRREKKS